MAAEITIEELREWASELYKDEDLDDECREILNGQSIIYKDRTFKEVFATCKQEGRCGSAFDQYIHISPDRNGMKMSFDLPSDPRLQLTAFHNACLTTDFVWVDAMIRLGAGYERLTGEGETALSIACKLMDLDRNGTRITHPGRIRIIRRLLQLGVDPNIRCALQYTCGANDLAVCELLLANGADPTERADDGRLPKDHLAAPLRRRFTKLKRGQRPEPGCWCLSSGRLLRNCHGQEYGMEADAKFGCPCKSGKIYGKCCKKRGIKFRETREQFSQGRSICFSENNPLPEIYERLLARKGPDDPIFADISPEDYNATKKKIAEMLLSNTSRPFDPAFSYAFLRMDFMPTYWKNFLPKNERILRQKEWNDAVDEYIASNRAEDDTRTTREIEECAKIGVDGVSLFKDCSYCNAKEQREGEFALCSRCKMRAYCGQDCQKRHWKEGHKTNCKMESMISDHCPLDLPSQLTMFQATQILGEKLAQHL